MTQKECLQHASMLAQRCKNIASNLKSESEDYDIRFPLSYAKQLEEAANDFLNNLKKLKK